MTKSRLVGAINKFLELNQIHIDISNVEDISETIDDKELWFFAKNKMCITMFAFNCSYKTVTILFAKSCKSYVFSFDHNSGTLFLIDVCGGKSAKADKSKNYLVCVDESY